MPLTVDPLDLSYVGIVPWNQQDGEFGIAWELTNGRRGIDHIGSREFVEGEMSRIKRARLRRISGRLDWHRPLPAKQAV
jgi:hypothetical protein